MTPELKRKIEVLSSGSTKDYLVDFLEYVKNQVADVRTSFNVKPENQMEVRMGVIQVIDELIINKLRKNPKQKSEDEYN